MIRRKKKEQPYTNWGHQNWTEDRLIEYAELNSLDETTEGMDKWDAVGVFTLDECGALVKEVQGAADELNDHLFEPAGWLWDLCSPDKCLEVAKFLGVKIGLGSVRRSKPEVIPRILQKLSEKTRQEVADLRDVFDKKHSPLPNRPRKQVDVRARLGGQLPSPPGTPNGGRRRPPPPPPSNLGNVAGSGSTVSPQESLQEELDQMSKTLIDLKTVAGSQHDQSKKSLQSKIDNLTLQLKGFHSSYKFYRAKKKDAQIKWGEAREELDQLEIVSPGVPDDRKQALQGILARLQQDMNECDRQNEDTSRSIVTHENEATNIRATLRSLRQSATQIPNLNTSTAVVPAYNQQTGSSQAQSGSKTNSGRKRTHSQTFSTSKASSPKTAPPGSFAYGYVLPPSSPPPRNKRKPTTDNAIDREPIDALRAKTLEWHNELKKLKEIEKEGQKSESERVKMQNIVNNLEKIRQDSDVIKRKEEAAYNLEVYERDISTPIYEEIQRRKTKCTILELEVQKLGN